METFLVTSLGKFCFLSFCENCSSLDQSLIYFFTVISYWEAQPKADAWGALTHCLTEVPIIVSKWENCRPQRVLDRTQKFSWQ